MGPASSRFWLPLTRLAAFFVTVVVAGNVVFHTFRPTAADVTTADETSDYFLRKRKRIQKQFQRTLEKFFGVPVAGAATDGMSESPLIPRPLVPAVEVVKLVPPAPEREPLQAISPPAAPPAPGPVRLGFLEPEPAPFIWPPLPEPPRPVFAPIVDLPGSLGLCNDLAFRSELVAEWYRRGAPDPLADVGDVLLKGPELLLDSIFTCASGMGSRPAVRAWDDDGGSITAQMLDVNIGPRQERIGREFLIQLGAREQRYFSGFSDSSVNTFGFQNGTESADLHQLALDQRKVFWDALRRTYLARYKVNAEEKLKEDAWYLDRWSGWDFAVLPPLMGAYVYYRGIDKKFTVLGTRLTVSVEPVSEWARRNHDLNSAASLEWSMKGWPVGVIVSTGLHDGRYGLDFVGIGTSIGAVRQALEEKSSLAEHRQ
jgi:hypothetical protein